MLYNYNIYSSALHTWFNNKRSQKLFASSFNMANIIDSTVSPKGQKNKRFLPATCGTKSMINNKYFSGN